MSWRQDLHQHYYNQYKQYGIRNIHPNVLVETNETTPEGYWQRMATDDMQRFETMMHKYRKDRPAFIEFMIHEGIDPLTIGDILDWQDTLKEMRETLHNLS